MPPAVSVGLADVRDPHAPSQLASPEHAGGNGWAHPVGGTGAAAAAAPARLQPAARHHSWQPSLSQDRAVQACLTVGQSLVVLTQWGKSAGLPLLVRLQPAAILALLGLLLALMLSRPKFYWSNRTVVLPAWLTLLLWLIPSQRSTGVGTALVLERQPRAGAVGALLDLLTLLVGSRALPYTVWGLFASLPPTATLVARGSVALFTSNAPAYCNTLLLSAPLTRQRQAEAAGLLELASMPLVALQPIVGQVVPSFSVVTGEAPSEAVCRATVSWLLLLVSGLAPLLVGVWTWHPPPPPAGGAEESSAGWHSSSSGSSSSSAWQRARRLARRSVAASDSCLYVVLGGSLQRSAVRAVLTWYLLANCWLLCKITVGLA